MSTDGGVDARVPTGHGANGSNRDIRGRSEKESGVWLSIHAACAYLGVDQSTLRRWSDAGRVPVFRTPGGHRRYAVNDLRALVGGGAPREERSRVSNQALTDRSLSAYEDAFLRGARERRWYRAYGSATQEEHRRLGRRLVDLAIRFASLAPSAGDRESLLGEGRQIGEHYGRAGAAAGLSASETVEAFLYFRHPVVQTMTRVVEEEELATGRAVRLFVETAGFMDQVLVATIAAHEATTAGSTADEQTLPGGPTDAASPDRGLVG